MCFQLPVILTLFYDHVSSGSQKYYSIFDILLLKTYSESLLLILEKIEIKVDHFIAKGS